MTPLSHVLFWPFTVVLAFAVSVRGAPTSVDLAGFGVGDILDLLGIGLVKHINVFITLETLITNTVSANFDVQNPLPFEITIDRVVTQAGVAGVVDASFNQSFTSFIIPAFGSANSGTFPDVTLPLGALAALAIIPLQELDILNADVSVRVATIEGKLGIPIPLDGLKQTAVNTTYTLNLSET